jgi:GNAT superfamily N-acetyltransferase
MTEIAEPGLPTISVTLRDDSIAELRPIHPDDRVLLVEGLRQMSIESRFARFGTGVDHLTDAELDYLTNVDHVAHVAWGAVIDGEPAGVGRYVQFSDTLCADIAVTVVDRFQGRGLGRILFDALIASARANHVDELCFAVQPFNEAVRRMLAGVEATLEETGGMVQGRFDVTSVPPTDLDDRFAELLARFQARDTPPSLADLRPPPPDPAPRS